MKSTCPDEETLAAYVDGLLPEHLKTDVESHLSLCDTCLEEFTLTNRMLRGGDPASEACTPPLSTTQSAVHLVARQNARSTRSLTEKVRDILDALHRRLVEPLRLNGLRSAPVAVRSQENALTADLFRVKKHFKGIDTDIEIEKTGKNIAHIRIRVSDENESGNGIRVTLKRGDRELCSSLISGGHVLFEDISFGPCKLIFDRDGASLGAYLFNIKESPNGKK